MALAGISIPVIIHLWNQRPGKILKVGSISLIPEETKEYRRSLQLSDLLLLLLRCLLIGALAIALANPAWKKSTTISNQKGWILIPEKNFSQIYSYFKPTVDSLYKEGFEFHYFNEGFAKEKLANAIANPPDTASISLSYWKLAESLDAKLSSTFPVYIFTDNYLKHFSGNRPVLSFHPLWQTYTPLLIKPQRKTESTDTSSLRVAIFTDKYSNDARYVKAALDAIQSVMKKSIIITPVSKEKQIPSGQDWLFWLSDIPVSNKNSKNIFAYATGNTNGVSSVINFQNDSPPLALYKITKDSLSNENKTIWQDGFGNPILSHNIQNDKNFYLFFTHFDPSWNELVWNDTFPEIIYALLINKEKMIRPVDDIRIVDQQQLQPAYKDLQATSKSSALDESIDITALFWILTLILFFAERIVSYYNTKLKTNE